MLYKIIEERKKNNEQSNKYENKITYKVNIKEMKNTTTIKKKKDYLNEDCIRFKWSSIIYMSTGEKMTAR